MDENLHALLRIDIQKIIRVLDNLFTNAAKYSDDGAEIRLSAQKSEDRKMLIVSVSDTGYGISEEALPYIFGRTYTVSSARTPNSKTGSGLGLSIVKAIIERHGGTIRCESEQDKGSSFIFTLPIM